MPLPRPLSAMLLPALLSSALSAPAVAEPRVPPRLEERSWQAIVLLSGGERTTLALVRITPAGTDPDGAALFTIRVLHVVGAAEVTL